MKTAMKKFLVGFIFLAAVIGCSETDEVYYETLGDAIRHGAIERGWIPEVLPKSSREIFGRHDIDTNAIWLRFKFSKNDIYVLVAHTAELKHADAITIHFPVLNARWWHGDLRNKLIDEKSGFRLYKYERAIRYDSNNQKEISAFIAIDWNSDTAYYWQAPR